MNAIPREERLIVALDVPTAGDLRVLVNVHFDEFDLPPS